MKYVIEFTKTGRMAYISHLDLSRVFLRALRMTGLRPAYSQGFNPHPKMSIALPLSLGQSSVCELIEVETASDSPVNVAPAADSRLNVAPAADNSIENAIRELNARLPDDLHVTSMRKKPDAFPKSLASYVEAAKYEILCDGIYNANDRLAKFFAQEHILIEKTSKKTGKISEKDIRPQMLDYNVKTEIHGWLLCRVTLSAGAGSVLSPKTFFDAFIASIAGEEPAGTFDTYIPSITRLAIFGQNGNILSGLAD